MRQLTILYDDDCAFCRRCRQWLEAQPKHLAMRFVAQGSPEAHQRWPTLATDQRREELLVVSDEGGIYRGERAWIMVLYGLRRYRSLSLKLARPGLRRLARQAVDLIARHRHGISRFVGDDRLIARAGHPRRTAAACSDETCGDTMARLHHAKAAAAPQAAAADRHHSRP